MKSSTLPSDSGQSGARQRVRRPARHLWLQLLSILREGRLEDGAIEQACAGDSPLPWLMVAAARVGAGDRVGSVAALERALERQSDAAAVQLAAARLCFLQRRYDRALAHLDAVARLAPEQQIAVLARKTELCEQLVWIPEALTALDAWIALEPKQLKLYEHGWRIALRQRDDVTASRYLSQALRLDPGSASLHRQAAEAAWRSGRLDEAAEHARRALALAPRDVPAAILVCRNLVLADRVDEAEGILTRLEEGLGPRADLAVELGRFRLWRGDWSGARTRAIQALDLDPSLAGGYRLRGAVAVIEGDFLAALPDLEHATTLDPQDHEALTWKAEALCGLGRFEEGVLVYKRAMIHSGHFNPGASLGHMAATLFGAGWTAALRLRRPDNALGSAALEERAGAHKAEGSPAHEQAMDARSNEQTMGGFRELVPDAERRMAAITLRGQVDVVDLAIRRLLGNRTIMATRAARPDEAPGIYRVLSTSPRDAARLALESIATQPVEQVWRAFDEVEKLYPGDSMGMVHRGELKLWLGDYQGALEDFRESLRRNRITRWGWIGQQGVYIQLGDLDASLAIAEEGIRVMKGAVGSVFIYRGEAYRRKGKHQEALADLTECIVQTPTRLSAWINLALVQADLGDWEGHQANMRKITAHARGLLSDAVETLGGTMWVDAPDHRELGIEALHRCLDMMRGNRSSSCITYFPYADRLRIVQRPRLSGAFDPHARDAAELAALEQWLASLAGQAGREPT